MKEFHDWMLKQGWTVATAESVTVGKVASKCAQESGSSAYFKGGVVAYNLDMKMKLLGVLRKTAEPCNCVSEQMAQEMALGVTNLFDSDIGIATTGYAEAYPEAGITEPYAWMAIHIRPLCLTLTREVNPGVIVGFNMDTRIAYQDEIADVVFAYVLDLLYNLN